MFTYESKPVSVEDMSKKQTQEEIVQQVLIDALKNPKTAKVIQDAIKSMAIPTEEVWIVRSFRMTQALSDRFDEKAKSKKLKVQDALAEAIETWLKSK